MSVGWIKMHRTIKEHWIWKDSNKLKWWLDLLLRANYCDKKLLIGNFVLNIRRGALYTSSVNLSKEWEVDRKTVNRFLKLLQREGMIEVETNNYGTVIAIVNYDQYQNQGVEGFREDPMPKAEHMEKQESKEHYDSSKEALKDSVDNKIISFKTKINSSEEAFKDSVGKSGIMVEGEPLQHHRGKETSMEQEGFNKEALQGGIGRLQEATWENHEVFQDKGKEKTETPIGDRVKPSAATGHRDNDYRIRDTGYIIKKSQNVTTPREHIEVKENQDLTLEERRKNQTERDRGKDKGVTSESLTGGNSPVDSTRDSMEDSTFHSTGATTKNINNLNNLNNSNKGKKEKNAPSRQLSPLVFPTGVHKKIYEYFGEVTYRTWFMNTDIQLEGANTAKFGVKNEFMELVLREKFKEPLRELMGKSITIDLCN